MINAALAAALAAANKGQRARTEVGVWETIPLTGGVVYEQADGGGVCNAYRNAATTTVAWSLKVPGVGIYVGAYRTGARSSAGGRGPGASIQAPGLDRASWKRGVTTEKVEAVIEWAKRRGVLVPEADAVEIAGGAPGAADVATA